MKKINIKFLLSCFALLVVSACTEEDLDLNPISAIGDNGFYNNAKEVEGAVIAIYDGLQDVPLREFALTEMRSDNTKSKSREGDWAQFESFDVQPTNLAVGSYWKANYNVIFRANRVLENLGVVNSTVLSNQYEGEALFTRALAHFNLVRAYGNVPLIDKVIIQSDTDYFAKVDATTVLSAIEADLTSAAGLLAGRSATPNGRATSGAAQALLAKVKLTLGDYSGAATLLSNVLGNSDYALVENYADVFYSEMNSEILFAIPYKNDDANESQDFSFEMTLGGVVSGLNFVTNDFASSIAPEDTERAAVLFNPLNPIEVGKFLTSSSDVRLCGNDWIVLRLADVHLMYAEALMAGAPVTQDAEAIASYNAVRARAGMSIIESGGGLTEDMLLAERRIELAFENHRFYDLIRFGKAQEVLGNFANNGGYTFAPTDLVLPIPQAEINVSQGLLTQNPGY